MFESTILTYTEIDREAWSRLVQTSRTGTWFQSPEAYELFASLPEMFAPFAFGVVGKPESDSGQIIEATLRGVCVGYVTKEKSRLRQFFTRRAIILGGPCLAEDATDEEVTALLSTLNAQLSTLNAQHSTLNSQHSYLYRDTELQRLQPLARSDRGGRVQLSAAPELPRGLYGQTEDVGTAER